MSEERTVSKKPKHRTSVELHRGIEKYTWRCSCGHYDARPMTYVIASAGAEMHRKIKK